MRTGRVWAWVAGMLLLPAFVLADVISQQEAATAAQNWVRRGRTLGAAVGNSAAGVVTYSGANGGALFHVVRMAEGGLVITSADDGVTPVIAFSPEGTFEADGRNPLWTMLNKDLPERVAAAELRRTAKGGLALLSAATEPEAGSSEAEWAELLGDGTQAFYLTSVSDVRVSPLVQSRWSQDVAPSGANCFNYYTPSNYVCGCVATAGAQIMRYHKWPTGSVTAATYACEVDNAEKSLTMQGGTYDWNLMPLVPGYSITEAQCKAIGKLTSDVGISCLMSYASDGSAAPTYMLAERFTDRFGYANAIGYSVSSGSIGTSYFAGAILANLDAEKPVVLGISGSNGGHAVVGDGYGYSGGTLYVHLNMGWSGGCDYWYNLPTIDDDYYGFTLVQSIVYNVFPTNAGSVATGAIVSGRVLDGDGTPVVGATVTATRAGSSSQSFTTRTRANGVYGIPVAVASLASSTAYTVTAAYGSASASVSANVKKCTGTTYFSDGSFWPGTGSVGNSWGNDITLSYTPTVDSVKLDKTFHGLSVEAASRSLGLAASGDWTAGSSRSWLTLARTSGTSGVSNLIYNVSSNTTTAIRTAVISVTNGTAVATCTVYQDTLRWWPGRAAAVAAAGAAGKRVLVLSGVETNSVCISDRHTSCESTGVKDLLNGGYALWYNESGAATPSFAIFGTGAEEGAYVAQTNGALSAAQLQAWLLENGVTVGSPEQVDYPWLAGYGILTANSTAAQYESAAVRDTDGDGMANWEEFIALTDPTNELSFFQTEIDVTGDTVTVGCNPCVPDERTYSFEGKVSLTNDWEELDFSRHYFFRAKVSR